MPKIKVDAQKLAIVLANVLPHAGVDDTLPVLTCVEMTLDADGLTFAATDRYSLAWETVAPTMDRDDKGHEFPVLREGEATVLLLGRDVKAILAAAKKIKNAYDLVEVDVADDGSTVTVRSLDIAGMMFRTFDGVYVKWRTLVPAGEPRTVPMVGLAPLHMAKLADVVDQESAGVRRRRGERSQAPLIFSFYGTTKTVGVRFGATFRALLMPIRVDEIEEVAKRAAA